VPAFLIELTKLKLCLEITLELLDFVIRFLKIIPTATEEKTTEI
jgi:hypothetical protein